ncbi:MCE family protein [Rhodococcoides kyotonense]|uniref:Phospholipid/cholesterol/gamma-HCH transport system substrate-binding protein n=1 Tax=Rhodococcoides kyotonense TaxID=398843 RepID=A0A239F8T4_9NOCA|nr:MCE family protein [Rhodococcus kyotonensis]SNS53207.1 phospholipid/cholesterol/gamma-HCH transport system substrate-binding protein [Rhodococcus kyotonensis]
MSSLRRPLLQLGGFATAGLLSALVVVDTLSVPVPGETDSYTAEFSGIEGLRAGNDVTLAGVRVGKVDDVDFTTDSARTSAVVRFSVQNAVSVPGNITAAIRYGDMLGARYLALDPPTQPTGSMSDGDTIPLERTTPPVDLTALVNGFEPLFDAIDPGQVNALARSIVAAFQGEAGTIESLLRHVATVTRGVTDNEQVLTDLITDLSSVVETMDSRRGDIRRLITGLTEMSTTVAQQSDRLITLLDDGSVAVHALTEIVTHAAQPLDAAVADATAMTDAWIPNTVNFDRTMTLLPQLAGSINHLGDYGSWLNLYTCNFTLKAGEQEANIFGGTHTEICR